VVVAGLRRDAKIGAKEGRAATSSSIVKETAAGCCLGRSLVVASGSLDVARLYSTVPRARPPETLQEQPFPTHDEWKSKHVFTGVAQ
jgi:hypothetical protein